ncbi:S-methyl-5-thioribose-1-phosphate isomerase [Pyrococcus furiosus DSM 3638]|uniref:Putative methylthioribose-1-phosphate isomerase n=3 Tax=Pyrococcus furiosus TaxID=2261 RepID=MTNA_PYRFU|nr:MULTISPECIES: S-methyl-5-thioribose-1-phosphate isomerase [Pyrococcus]Q8U178.1 RecName: Full=Putative methylthioribose-1-phosphate isomerase; Short=M1Pi; Short=MTR-1-P isomerase; AltName: Full=MTNA-like protein; Short=aMTNA; AltName: Full=S-methyl-5-thioribose-1-phosphate isomerase [Pyrococcus furiosus DSM 3638]AAL81473.1 translation initiation factor eIF-2 beta chain [Pyrococcus furiosus DSM 3638]AFN04129.1 translation initiation factor IF-2B subunit beta [Pyrococcus furiosus COM1]MDK287036
MEIKYRPEELTKLPRSVEYREGKVYMINQRLLPREFKVEEFTTVEAVAEAIKNMTVRGAPAIGAAAAFGLALYAETSKAKTKDEFFDGFYRAYETLKNTRPTAVNLFWALNRIKKLVEEHREDSLDEIKRLIVEEAQKIADEDVEANLRMGHYGAEVLPEGNILTHCNAGSLATVHLGTVGAVVRVMHKEGTLKLLWLDETRPVLQGARLSAWEYSYDGLNVKLIADNAAAFVMQQGKVDAIIVGADRIVANGDFANKIGTYMLAVLAKEHGIPFFTVAPLSSIDMSLSSGKEIPIEERSPEEVLTCGGCRIAPDVPVYNPAFDVTPHKYLTGIITDRGVVWPPFKRNLKKLFETL